MPEHNTLDLLEQAGVIAKQDAPAETETQEQTNTEIPPAAETASVETAKPTEQAQATYDPDEVLVKITDGKVKSSTELAGILDKYSQFDDFENRLKALDNENTELKAKVATDPFANDLSKKFNDLLKGGAKPEQVDAFLKLNKHDNFESMSAYDAKLLALQVRDGLTEKEARTHLDEKYNLDANVHDEDTIAKGQINLKVDARGDREFLSAHKAQVSQAPQSEYEQQQAIQAQKQTDQLDKLAPIAKNALKEISFAGININGKADEKAILADFTPSEESMKTLPDKVAQFIKNEWNNIPANDAGAQRISDFAKSILILENHEAWRQHAVNVAEKKIREEYHNPSAIQRGVDNTANAGKSDRDARSAAVKEHYNI